MPKLKKEDFNRTFRFRKSREGRLVSCASCDSMSGESGYGKEAFCGHEERFIKIKLADYLGPGFGSWNIAASSVCDAYSSKPLLGGIRVEPIPEEHAIILNDIIHASSDCPYIIEEVRAGKKLPEPRDVSEWNSAMPHSLCEMPCCEKKLPILPGRIDYYRRANNLKPDGTESTWAPQTLEHEIRVLKSEQEIIDLFDLSRFRGEGDLYDRISAAEKHLRDNCNRLGTVRLSGAVSPIMLRCSPVEHPSINSHGELEVWVSDDRVFDWKSHINHPMRGMGSIPEGVHLCVDAKKVLPYDFESHSLGSGWVTIYGNVRSAHEEKRRVPGAEHFIEIGAIAYSDVGHGDTGMVGIFGQGFHAEMRTEE